jgi:hypothetical protein
LRINLMKMIRLKLILKTIKSASAKTWKLKK